MISAERGIVTVAIVIQSRIKRKVRWWFNAPVGMPYFKSDRTVSFIYCSMNGIFS
jgi:hypothetical protein